MNEKNTSARDAALAAVAPERRETLLRTASDLGVHGTDDIVWSIVASVINANAAAQAAGDAATRVQTAVQGIPGTIYDGAAKASADVKALIETSIAGTVKASLDQAVQAGAAALRQAAADLPNVGRDHQNQIVGEWKAVLASAARDHALAGFFQKLSINITALAVLIGGIFLGGVFSGAVSIRYIMAAQHRLMPSGWRLDVGRNGKPLCGGLSGRTVCLARRTRPQ